MMKYCRQLAVVVVGLSVVACSAAPEPPTGKTEGPLASEAGAPAAASGTPAASTPTAAGACKAMTSDPCEACMVQKCCAPINAFESDPQAKQLAECAGKCEQSAQSQAQYDSCIKVCETAAPQAAAKNAAIESCGSTNCSTQCAAPSK